MAVSKKRIMNQMMKELKIAMESNDEGKIAQHIASIKSLCEVMLEDEKGELTAKRPSTTDILSEYTRLEDKKMYRGESDSIFDF